MTKLKNLLRCYVAGMGIKSIASAFHLSRNTVRKYVRKYQESGMTPEQMLSLSEEKLRELFLEGSIRNRKPSPRMEVLEALVPDYVKRLSHRGVTIKSLHDEYLQLHGTWVTIWYTDTYSSIFIGADSSNRFIFKLLVFSDLCISIAALFPRLLS